MMQAKLDKKTFSALVVKNQETLFHTAKAILFFDDDAETAEIYALCPPDALPISATEPGP